MDLSNLDSDLEVKTGGTDFSVPLQAGVYAGKITGASLEKHDKYGWNVNLELTVDKGRRVWATYYLEGEYKEVAVKNFKESLLNAGVEDYTKGAEIPERLEMLKGRSVKAYVGVNKKNKNWFAIKKLNQEAAEGGFDPDEEVPW